MVLRHLCYFMYPPVAATPLGRVLGDRLGSRANAFYQVPCGLAALAEERPVDCGRHKVDGEALEFACHHTMNDDQIQWFEAGSALNIIRQRTGG